MKGPLFLLSCLCIAMAVTSRAQEAAPPPTGSWTKAAPTPDEIAPDIAPSTSGALKPIKLGDGPTLSELTRMGLDYDGILSTLIDLQDRGELKDGMTTAVIAAIVIDDFAAGDPKAFKGLPSSHRKALFAWTDRLVGMILKYGGSP